MATDTNVADTFTGSSGADWVSYESSSDTSGVTVTLNTGTSFAAVGDGAEGDQLAGVNNLIGSEHNDRLTGNSGANILRGGDGADTLDGGAGDDTLQGGAGKDTYVFTGSFGHDTLQGGAGKDTYVFTGSFGHDTIQNEEDASNLYFKGARSFSNLAFSRDTDGNVIIAVGRYKVTIEQSAYDDGRYIIHHGAGNTPLGRLTQATIEGETITAAANAGSDLMLGSAEEDTLDGQAGNDNLYGYGGDDTLIGGAGRDTLDGGAGTDTVSYADSQDTDNFGQPDGIGVTANLYTRKGLGDDAEGDVLVSIENLIGSAYDDTLIGSVGANTLQGGAGNDKLYGGAGNDILEGDAGGDRLDGGSGFDYASYEHSKDADDNKKGVIVSLLAGGEISGDDAEGDTFFGIEGLIGSIYDDTLTGSSAGNRLIGGKGNDTLDGGRGNDGLFGGAGTDTYVFSGNFGVDTIQGDADGGTLQFVSETTGIVASQFLLTRGDAYIRFASSKYVVIKQFGDVVTTFSITYGTGGAGGTGEKSGELLLGTTVADASITGGVGADFLYGLAGDDTLQGGLGGDKLDGGAGVDTASYADSEDTEGDAGSGVTVNLTTNRGYFDDAAGDILSSIENLIGSTFDDTLTGSTAANILQGGEGRDNLYGGAGIDTLLGGEDDDRLTGGAGNDMLFGGEGGHADRRYNDILEGGAGTDTYVFEGSLRHGHHPRRGRTPAICTSQRCDEVFRI